MANDNNIYQVVVKGKIQNQDYRNVMHFGGDVDANDQDWTPLLLALATAVMQCYVTVLLPGLPASFSLQGVSAKRIYPAITDEVEYTTGAGPGTGAGEALPSFVSCKVELKTGTGGRRNRGRIFLPGPTEGNTGESTLSVTGAQLFTDFMLCIAGKFIGASATQPYRLGVLSRAAIKGGSNIQAAYKEVKSYSVSTILAVMRRRKVGSGS